MPTWTPQARRLAHRAALGLLAAAFLALLVAAGVEAWAAPPGARGVALALLAIEAVVGSFALALLAALAPREPVPVRPLPGEPRVAILVPVAAEAPEVLAATLAGVSRLTYRNVETWVLDDTRDRAGAAALEAAATAAGARYLHRAEPRGFKAGALNDALPRVEADWVVVLDVDHVPEPDMVERLLERFVDERTAFVQGKHAWRNGDSRFRRLAALLFLQFFEVVEREKERRGTVVFCGSGAMFRRAALLDCGGFPEETLVEDFDVSLALLARGWRGRFADAVVVRGVLPWTATDQIRQLWRWSVGTTRVLVLRARSFATARAAPLAVRAELLLDASAYLAAGLIPLAGVLLLASGLAGTAPGPAGSALALFVPGLLLAGHVGGAAVSLRRAGERVSPRVLSYHLVSLAFTPILSVSGVWALLGGVGSHGRVSKIPAAARHAGTATLAVTGVTFVFGIALLAASAVLFGLGHGAWVWAAELGGAFLLPLALVLHRSAPQGSAA